MAGWRRQETSPLVFLTTHIDGQLPQATTKMAMSIHTGGKALVINLHCKAAQATIDQVNRRLKRGNSRICCIPVAALDESHISAQQAHANARYCPMLYSAYARVSVHAHTCCCFSVNRLLPCWLFLDLQSSKGHSTSQAVLIHTRACMQQTRKQWAPSTLLSAEPSE